MAHTFQHSACYCWHACTTLCCLIPKPRRPARPKQARSWEEQEQANAAAELHRRKRTTAKAQRVSPGKRVSCRRGRGRCGPAAAAKGPRTADESGAGRAACARPRHRKTRPSIRCMCPGRHLLPSPACPAPCPRTPASSRSSARAARKDGAVCGGLWRSRRRASDSSSAASLCC